MAYSERDFGSSGYYGEDSEEEALSGSPRRNRPRSLRSHVEKGQELTGRDLAEIVKLLECKLAWYGFRSVKVGPFIRIQDRKVLIDLLDRGEVLCSLELDLQSGAPASSDGRPLAPLMNSLRERPYRKAP